MKSRPLRRAERFADFSRRAGDGAKVARQGRHQLGQADYAHGQTVCLRTQSDNPAGTRLGELAFGKRRSVEKKFQRERLRSPSTSRPRDSPLMVSGVVWRFHDGAALASGTISAIALPLRITRTVSPQSAGPGFLLSL